MLVFWLWPRIRCPWSCSSSRWNSLWRKEGKMNHSSINYRIYSNWKVLHFQKHYVVLLFVCHNKIKNLLFQIYTYKQLVSSSKTGMLQISKLHYQLFKLLHRNTSTDLRKSETNTVIKLWSTECSISPFSSHLSKSCRLVNVYIYIVYL